MAYPNFAHSLALSWLADIRARPHAANLIDNAAVYDIPHYLPPLSAISSAASLRDYASTLDSNTYTLTTRDMSSFPAKRIFNRTNSDYNIAENAAANRSSPLGPLHPRTYLLMWYRADALAALGSTRPPRDWDELLDLLQAHAQAARQTQQQQAGTGNVGGGLPQWGLCVTTSVEAGRVADLLAAIAASVVQHQGTRQGYWFGFPTDADGVWDEPGESAGLDDYHQYLLPMTDSPGWRYAAKTLAQLLAYNAPNQPRTNGSKIDATLQWWPTVSPHFLNGSCMVTLEIDAALPYIMRSAALQRPGALGVAPLPGSRVVMDRGGGGGSGSSSGVLRPCTAELCAVSTQYDTRYQQVPEPAAGAQYINRAPYSVMWDGDAEINYEKAGAWTYDMIMVLYYMYTDAILPPMRLRKEATDAARAALGYVRLADGTWPADTYASTPWERMAAGPFNVSGYEQELGMGADAAQAYLRAVWHGLHHPNAAPDVFSAQRINWFRWALGDTAGNLAASVAAGGLDFSAAASNATARLTAGLNNALQAFGARDARRAYATSIGLQDAPPVPRRPLQPAKASASQNVIVIAAVVPAVVVLLAGLGVAYAVFRLRRQHRDLLGRVRAPRPGPDTTLLVSDVQNSTVLWEVVPTAAMEEALRLHHDTFRRLMPKHNAYESATEGDSFILAFASPRDACEFAAACQLALLQQPWPPELLAHPDAAVLLVEQVSVLRQASTGAASSSPHGNGAVATAPHEGIFSRLSHLLPGHGACPHSGPQQMQQLSRMASVRAMSPATAQNGTASTNGRWTFSNTFTFSTNASSSQFARVSGLDSPGLAPRPGTDITLPPAADPGSVHGGGQGQAGTGVSGPSPSGATGGSSGDVAGGVWWPGANSTWGGMLEAKYPVVQQAGAGTATDADGSGASAHGQAPANLPVTPRPRALVSFKCQPDGGTAGGVVAYRGLRVRMGLHSGLDDAAHVMFNKVASAYKYYGPFAETAKAVSDAAPGGMVVLSAAAFARLRNTARGGQQALAGVVLVYAGHHALAEEHAVQLTRRPTATGAHIVATADDGTASSVEDGADVENGADFAIGVDGSALYLAVPQALACRLAHIPPLRTVRPLQHGCLSAPTGVVTIAFMKVVGVAALMADIPGLATRALASFQRLACRLLCASGGYLLEGGDGLVLAAFGAPPAGVQWALDCVEQLKEQAWEAELLAHELCEEVATYAPAHVAGASSSEDGHGSMMVFGAAEVLPAVGSASRATLGPIEVAAARQVLYRGLRIKVGLDVGPASHALGATSGRLEYRGKVMNRAARITGCAAAGQVVCSAGVWRAVEACGGLADASSHVVGLNLGPVALKGVAGGVECVQCVRQRRLAPGSGGLPQVLLMSCLASTDMHHQQLSQQLQQLQRLSHPPSRHLSQLQPHTHLQQLLHDDTGSQSQPLSPQHMHAHSQPLSQLRSHTPSQQLQQLQAHAVSQQLPQLAQLQLPSHSSIRMQMPSQPLPLLQLQLQASHEDQDFE